MARHTYPRTLWPCLWLASVFASCSLPHAGTVSTTTRDGRAAAAVEGVYAICQGAYAHRESIVLRDGRFEHYIQTHEIYGGRAKGTYTLAGDTLVLDVQQEGPAPQGVERAISLDYSFVVGTYAGYPVLWRGTEEARRVTAQSGDVSPYSALFYGGASQDERQEPTCSTVRQRGTR